VCAGHTKSGARCRRRAVAGSDYCALHADQAPPPVPKDINRTELDDAIADLVGGHEPQPFGMDEDADPLGGDGDANSSSKRRPRAYGATADEHTTSGPFDELRQFVGHISENVNRIRDIAVRTGMVDEGLIERFLGDLAHTVASVSHAMAERLSGDYEEDEFGFDQRFTERILPIAKLLYDYWWRVDVEGIENVPASGRGLLVSNHAGAGIPFDGAMIKTAMMLEHPSPRHVRLLVLDWLMGLPYLADLMKQTGQVLACAPNAYELLNRDELIAVFPEGVKGMAKPFSQRYNLQRFGRGGFVRIALRTGSPIIPVAVVGSEEIYPKIANIPIIPKLIGAPFVPMTPLFPMFGLLGAIPLPSKWHIEFCDPIDVTQYPPEAADDRAFVLELSERVRATIQERLRANLLKRRTPFW